MLLSFRIKIYVQNFVSLVESLIALTQKHAKFRWDANCEEAFMKLVDLLINYPISTYPDFTKPFVL